MNKLLGLFSKSHKKLHEAVKASKEIAKEHPEYQYLASFLMNQIKQNESPHIRTLYIDEFYGMSQQLLYLMAQHPSTELQARFKARLNEIAVIGTTGRKGKYNRLEYRSMLLQAANFKRSVRQYAFKSKSLV